MSVSLRYVSEGIPTVISLPGPSYGDSVATPHRVKVHLSMAGTIVTTKRSENSSKLLMAFDRLSKTEYDSLKNFLALANGNDFQYIHTDGTWSVKAPNIMERAARNSNYYSVSLEFVGARQTNLHQLLRLQAGGDLVLQTGFYLLLQTEH